MEEAVVENIAHTCDLEHEEKARVLVINTGGIIGNAKVSEDNAGGSVNACDSN